jgi:hypothetical protein
LAVAEQAMTPELESLNMENQIPAAVVVVVAMAAVRSILDELAVLELLSFVGYHQQPNKLNIQ